MPAVLAKKIHDRVGETEVVVAEAELCADFEAVDLATWKSFAHFSAADPEGDRAVPPESDSVATFSADDLPERHRDEFIRDFYGRIQMRLLLKPQRGQSLQFNAKTLIMPGMMCTKGSVSPMTWERTPELMDDNNDDIILTWNRGGYRLNMLGRGDFETRPGTAALVPMDRKFSIWTEDSRWTMALQFKRSLLAPLVKHLDDVAPDSIGRSHPAHNLLFNYLWSLQHMDTPAALLPMITRHVTDLLVVSLGDARGPMPPGVRAARLAAIKQYVARNLHDPGLSAEQVSRKFAISSRYIRQLFAEDETSFSDYVTDQRLAYVHSCLTDRRQALRRIADIAFESGFTEPSTFYRQFKLRYGMTPSDVRLKTMTTAFAND